MSSTNTNHSVFIQNIDETPINLEGILPAPLDILLGITYTFASKARFVAELPITSKLTQPMGLLHGGVSVALAESVGSFASNLHAQPGTAYVGQEINANHLKPGFVGDTLIATAVPVYLAYTTQVWQIEIKSKQHDHLICICRLTTHVMKLNPQKHKSDFLSYSNSEQQQNQQQQSNRINNTTTPVALL